jgi:hypothetical protein
VFVVTHYPRDPVEMERGTTFPVAAAPKKDIFAAGGPSLPVRARTRFRR